MNHLPPNHKIRVFISSTSQDMRGIRRLIRQIIETDPELQPIFEPVMMEDFPSQDKNAYEGSQRMLNNCDLYLGIIGQRYGFVDDTLDIEDEKKCSVTEYEYHMAKELGLTRLILKTHTSIEYDFDAPDAGGFVDVQKPYYFFWGLTDDEKKKLASSSIHNIIALRPTTENVKKTESLPDDVKKSISGYDKLQKFIRELQMQIWVEFDTPDKLAVGLKRSLLDAKTNSDTDTDYPERFEIATWIENQWIDPRLKQIQAIVGDKTTSVRLSQQTLIQYQFDTQSYRVPKSLNRHELSNLIVELQQIPKERKSIVITSEPGAGKTTTLTYLAKGLIERAKQRRRVSDFIKRYYPFLPFIFNLPDWNIHEYSLENWVKHEMTTRYRVSPDDWLAKSVILLDGLDQVLSENRDKCVEAINEFIEDNHQSYIVVCCRTQVYEELPQKVATGILIHLDELTHEDIRVYLAQVDNKTDGLMDAIQKQPYLQEFIKIPLYLNLIIAIYIDNPAVLNELSSVDNIETALFERYVALMFRQSRLHTRTKSDKKTTITGKFDETRTRQCLHIIAQNSAKSQTGEISQDIFYDQTIYLEEIQPAWISDDKKLRNQFDTIVATLSGTIGAITGVLALMILTNILPMTIHIQWASLLIGAFVGSLVGALYGGMSLAVFGIAGAILAIILAHSFSSELSLFVYVLIPFITCVIVGVVAMINAKLAFYTPYNIQPKQIFWRMRIGLMIAIVFTSFYIVVSGWKSHYIGILPFYGVGIMTLFGVAWLSAYTGLDEFAKNVWIQLHPQSNPASIEMKKNNRQEIVLQDSVRLQMIALISWLIIGVAFGFIFGQLKVGVVVGASIGIVTARVGIQKEAKWRKNPNEGIIGTILNSLQFSLLMSLIGFTIGFIAFDWIIGLQLGIVMASATWLAQGGYAIIQHIVLRYLLWRAYNIPLYLRQFFTEMVDKSFFVTVGNGYQFFHIRLQHYFDKLR